MKQQNKNNKISSKTKLKITLDTSVKQPARESKPNLPAGRQDRLHPLFHNILKRFEVNYDIK
jgi:hypothetical protein